MIYFPIWTRIEVNMVGCIISGDANRIENIHSDLVGHFRKNKAEINNDAS